MRKDIARESERERRKGGEKKMVERAVCSSEEETNSGSKIASCNVDREAGAPEVAGKLESHGKTRDPEVFKVIESLKQDRRESSLPGPTGRFSLFKWFKRGSRDSSSSWENREPEKYSGHIKSNGGNLDLDENEITSESSSNNSVETLYSTATVRSFAFQSGTIAKSDPKNCTRHFGEQFSFNFPNTTTRSVGPFGVGASKITTKSEANRFDVTKTLPANVLSKRRDITARYSLQSCNGSSSGFGSCGHIGNPRDSLVNKRNFLNDRGGGRVHVRGKRRAPNPPIEVTRSTKNEETLKHPKNRTRGKRRLAPKPPEVNPIKFQSPNDSATSETNFDPNSTVKEETKPPKKLDRCFPSPIDKETGSDPPNQVFRILSKQSEEKIDSVRLTEVKEVDKSTKTRPEEIATGNKEPNIPGREELQISKSENIISQENTVKKIFGQLNNIAETKLSSSEGKFTNSEITEGEQRENSSIPNTCRTIKDDETNLVTDNKNSEVAEEEKQSYDLTAGSISNDSLVLQGGVLLSKRDLNASLTSDTGSNASDVKVNISRSKGRISVTTGSQTSASAMPRPWYKRSVFEHSRDSGTSRRSDFLRNSSQLEVREEGVENTTASVSSATKLRHTEKNQDGGTLSRLNFFHRSDKSTEDRKKETKRKSGVSMLANISELDKEAAAIVQEEQARTRAASMLLQASKLEDEQIRTETEDIVQEMVTSVMESSPKRGTRALISKFNAIGNITKVTVNTSFFAKQPYTRESKTEKNEPVKSSRDREWGEKTSFEKSSNVRTDKDLSRYFLPAQKLVKSKTMEEAGEKSNKVPTSNDISARLSFFQNVSAGERKTHPEDGEISIEAKIDRLSEQVLSKKEKNRDVENSPKFSRLRINGLNEESVKLNRPEINEGKVRSEARKDFSDIFREIGNENRGKVSDKQETSATSQVSKVLDILVEAEKNDRRRANATSMGKNLAEPKKEPIVKISDAENPMKTDLREMLKEMKHSLPKRPKPNKIRELQTAPKSENKTEEKPKFISMNDKKKEFFLSASNEKSALLSPVTVVYPPPIRNGPIFVEATKSIPRETEDRDYDRQKVSSAAQTCGNLRKKISAPETKIESPKNPKKYVFPSRPVGNAIPGTSGSTKNTYQLIRPREFAQIEAIKTMKNNGGSENTYANVIEQSLYANALVPPRKENDPVVPQNAQTSRRFSEERLPETRVEINETEATGKNYLRSRASSMSHIFFFYFLFLSFSTDSLSARIFY